MRKIKRIINIAIIFIIIGVFLGHGLAYSSDISYLRTPLLFGDKKPNKKVILRESFVAEKDGSTAVTIAKAFLDVMVIPELEKIHLFCPEISESCLELAANIIMHGKGGSIEISYIENNRGMKMIEVIGVDNGDGMQNPDILLQHSIDAHWAWSGYFSGLLDKPDFEGGAGLRNLIVYPEKVIIEARGEKWVKKGKEIELLRNGDSDVKNGTKITLQWSGDELYKLVKKYDELIDPPNFKEGQFVSALMQLENKFTNGWKEYLNTPVFMEADQITILRAVSLKKQVYYIIKDIIGPYIDGLMDTYVDGYGYDNLDEFLGLRIIGICEQLDELLALDDNVFKEALIGAGFLGIPHNTIVGLAKNAITERHVQKTRELIENFKYEIIKADLFKIVRLSGKTPEEFLKQWYGESQLSQSLSEKLKCIAQPADI